MTEALTIIESPIGPVMPADEVAKKIGCGRATISNTVHKPENRALFAPYILTVRVKGKAGYRDKLCITKEGLDELIAHMRPIDRDGRSERIGTFRRALQTRNGDVVTLPLSDVLIEYGKRARALAEDWDVDIAVARKVLMAAAVEKYPDLTPCRALIPANPSPLELPEKTGSNSSEPELPKADPDYDRYFSLRKLAEFCQCEQKDARKILVDEGVVAYQNNHLILTKYGERFARLFTVMPEAPHRTYTEIRIRYSPDAVQLVRGKLFGIQTHLPQKATTGVSTTHD